VQVADNAMMALAPDSPARKRVVLKAGKRDSVASISQRYGVSASEVAAWNSVGHGAQFKPGQLIVVYQTVRHPQGRRTASKSSTQNKASNTDRKAIGARRTASGISSSATAPKAMRAVER
jgi:membrane-bound lytic murein transglycosylase D